MDVLSVGQCFLLFVAGGKPFLGVAVLGDGGPRRRPGVLWLLG
jgi:hypothetical protein